MQLNTSQYLKLEFIWWLFTIVLIVGVLIPIWNAIENFPFYRMNVIFIVAFVTISRYLFLLKFTFLGPQQYLKIGIILLSPILIFYLVSELNYFQTFLDEEGLEAVVGDLPLKSQGSMVDYIRSEILLFGVGSIISAIILPFRLLYSIWSLRNRGKI